MSNISSWDTTAANNNSAVPNGAPEGWAPSSVNDVVREMMAASARWYKDTQGSITSGGSSNAYTITSNSSHASLSAQSMIVFIANHTNTGAATLAVDGLTAKNIYYNGSALASGTIVSGNTYIVTYNGTGGVYDLISTANVDLSSLNAPIRSARTSNTQLGTADIGKVLDYTSGTFSQTFAACATLGAGWFVWAKNTGTGAITLDPNGTETIDGATTKDLPNDTVFMIFCDGSNLHTLEMLSPSTDNKVIVATGNGTGSTNTKIRRFLTTQSSTGNAITYADSASNGGSFTINKDGLYSISYSDSRGTSGDTVFGISLNSNQLTTDITSITEADRLQVGGGSNASGLSIHNVSITTRLAAGDVIRAHVGTNTPDASTAGKTKFSIIKIA